MTINTTANRASYLGNSATTAFSFPYKLAQAADLVVLDTVIATGVSLTRTLGVDYTLAGTQDAQGAYPSGCTVNMVTAPVTGDRLTLYRDPQMIQGVQHVDNDPMPAASIDDPLDLLTMIAQRNRELVLRSMRQPDGDPSGLSMILPPVAVRANKTLVFAGDGSIDVGSGGSSPTVTIPSVPNAPKALFDLRLNADGTAYELANPALKSGVFINILDPKYGASTGTGGNDTAAFNAALAEAAGSGYPVYMPPAPSGFYNVADVVVPSGVTLFGVNPPNYAVVFTRTVVRGRAGATRVLSLNAGTTGHYTIKMEGFDVDGLDKTIVGIGAYAFNGGPFLTLIGIGVRNCLSALGDGSYIQGVNATACSFFGNVVGLLNSIDGTFVACNFSANDNEGINLQAGANNNTFMACRYEFNHGHGIVVYDASKNIFHGTWDRNYKNGIWIANSGDMTKRTTGILIEDGSIFTRNGRNNVFGENAHIHIEGNPEYISIGKIYTLVGVDDDGGGPSTPTVAIDIELDMANTTILKIEGADLRGNTTGSGGVSYGAIQNWPLVHQLRVNNCVGFDDFSTPGFQTLGVDNTGFAYTQGGGHINNAATATYTIPLRPNQTTFSQYRYRLDFGWRNDVSGEVCGGSWLFCIERGAGAATILWANAASAEIGTAGLAVIGAGLANKVSFSGGTVATDGSSFILSVNNQLAAAAGLGNFDYSVRPV